MTQDYNDIQNSVLPFDVEEEAIPVPLDKILPWHRPRKQFIRTAQWEMYARRLITRLVKENALESGKINYLSLPGIDYFDVEIIAQLAHSQQLRLESTGFLAEAEGSQYQARSQIRLDSLIKKGLVEDTSTTFPYEFEQLASTSTPTYREIKRRTPFHIINIDACGSLAIPSTTNSSSILEGIYHLVELQLNAISSRWLLFLTTDVRPNNLSSQVIEALLKAIQQNAEESEAFKLNTIEYLGLDDSNFENSLRITSEDQTKFISFFVLGFSKWLLHNAQEVNWDVKCLDQYCYSTTPQSNDYASMACLAFEFVPRLVSLPNRHNAINILNKGVSATSTIDYSLQALKIASKTLNVDSYLLEEGEIQTKCAEGQLKMLEDSGYHQAALDEYRDEFIPS